MTGRPGVLRLVAGLCLLGLTAGAAEPSKAETDAFGFAQGLYVHRDFRSAIEEFRACLKTYPDSARAADARYRLADSLFQEGEFAEACTAYTDALARHPDHPEAARGLYNLGRSHHRLGQFDPALAAFRRAAAAGNEQVAVEAAVGIGESLARLQRYPEAVECYTAFLAAHPANEHRGDVLFALGWTQAALGRHEAAVEAFARLLKEMPDYAEPAKVRLALSDSLAALGRYEASAEALQALAGDAALKPDVLLRQAWNFFNSGRFEAAADGFAEFAKTYPGHALAGAANYNAGIARYKAGQYEAACAPLKLALASPDAAQAERAHYWLGLCHANLERFREAAETLAPLAAAPAHLDAEQQGGAAWHLAAAWTALGDHAKAIAVYQSFLKRAPDSPLAPAMTYALAVEREAAGDAAGAVETLRAALPALPPGDLRQKTLFALAEFLYRLKKPAEARPYLDELAAGGDPDPKVLYRQAWIQFDSAEYAQAEAAFKRLADGDSEFAAEAQFMHGRSLEELQRPDEAARDYAAYVAGPGERPMKEDAFYRLALLLPPAEARAALDAYARQFPKGRYLADVRLKLAEGLFAHGETAAAAELYRQAGEDTAASPAIRRAAAYGQAWTALKADRDDDAARGFAQLREQAADDEIGRDATLQLAEIAYRKDSFDEAAAGFAQLTDHPRHGERATYMLAWTRRKAGNAPEADRLFAAVLEKWPKGQFAPDAALRRAETLTLAGEAAAAATLLAAHRYADSPLREDALHVLCDALAQQGNWQELLARAEELRAAFPDSKRRHLASFHIGRACQELGLNERATESFLKTIEETDTVEAAQAQFNLGTLRFAEGNFAEAARLFLRVEMLYDYKDLSAKALYHAAEAFVRAGDEERAALYRKRLKETYPDSEWAKK